VAAAVVRTAAIGAGVGVAAALGFGAQDVALAVQPTGARAVLHIDGDVSGVVAGAPSRPLTLTLHNRGDVAAHVSHVRATPTGTVDGPARCAATSLRVGEWRGALAVPAGGTATVTVPVALAGDLPPGCAGAAYGLVYSAD
jgi:hypothetical protein